MAEILMPFFLYMFIAGTNGAVEAREWHYEKMTYEYFCESDYRYFRHDSDCLEVYFDARHEGVADVRSRGGQFHLGLAECYAGLGLRLSFMSPDDSRYIPLYRKLFKCYHDVSAKYFP